MNPPEPERSVWHMPNPTMPPHPHCHAQPNKETHQPAQNLKKTGFPVQERLPYPPKDKKNRSVHHPNRHHSPVPTYKCTTRGNGLQLRKRRGIVLSLEPFSIECLFVASAKIQIKNIYANTTHHIFDTSIQKNAMRCNGLCNALTLLTHRIVFANAPHCVFYFSMRYGQDDICGSQLITHNSLLIAQSPHNNVPSAACPAASTLICVVRALLYKVIVAFPSWSNITLGFQ